MRTYITQASMCLTCNQNLRLQSSQDSIQKHLTKTQIAGQLKNLDTKNQYLKFKNQKKMEK